MTPSDLGQLCPLCLQRSASATGGVIRPRPPSQTYCQAGGSRIPRPSQKRATRRGTAPSS
ncbi:hypothetical protein LX36DRAFT_656701 [Colletotrichum falcatum]|nr:hypothetical protein LX36DRAFT_656701 [Colletotrichum falcatum]